MEAGPVRCLRSNVIYRVPQRYVSFPDVVKTPNGKLLAAFRDSNAHFPPNTKETDLLLSESSDEGETWSCPVRFPHHPRDRGNWAWHCPRLSLLGDGRVALVCDLADPINQKWSAWISFSCNDGKTWSTPVDTRIRGILPDRIMDLGGGHLLSSVHRDDGPDASLRQILIASRNGGDTWEERSTIAAGMGRHFCEGSLVRLTSGVLACFLRENSFLHYPTYVTFSKDQGFSWSAPAAHPTHAHRPTAGLLDGDRILLTYRNVAGTPGLAAWVGAIDEHGFAPGGLELKQGAASLTAEGLRIATSGTSWDAVEYQLHPLRSWDVEALFKARLRFVVGGFNSCVLRCAGSLHIREDEIIFLSETDEGKTISASELGRAAVCTREFHDYAIHYQGGLLSVSVNGNTVISRRLPHSLTRWQRKISFGNRGSDPAHIVYFRDNAGESVWQSAELSLFDPKEGVFSWKWNASSGEMPDEYQRRRIALVDRETSGDWYDSGYSGWTKLDEKRVYCVNYRRSEEHRPYVVGYLLELL